jgi:hypothetical protein
MKKLQLQNIILEAYQEVLLESYENSELKIGTAKNIDIYANDQSSFADTMFYRLVDNNSGKEFEVSVDVGGEEVDLNYVKEEIPILHKIGFPHGDAIGNFIVKDINSELEETVQINESLLDEIEDEPQPEEEGEETAAPETVLEDATDTILQKFPTVEAAIIKLQTEDFKQFVENIDWISPRPTTFRVNLKNGQHYLLKWTGTGFEAQILGKKYFLNKIDDYQQALDKLSVLYKEGPMSGAGEEGEGADVDTGGGGGGGGDFPGEEGGGGGEDFGDEGGADAEEGGADLGGEEIDFEDGAEPDTE